MVKSDCLCQKNSLFKPKIVYQNETVFRNFNGIVIGRCQNCRLLKTVVQPKNKFNPQTTHADFYEENRSLFQSLFKNTINRIKIFKKNGAVLDVGCSSGIMLELLKKEDYDIWGIEPNKKAFQIAWTKLKNKIFNGSLSDFVRQNNRMFDIVVYNHVFEHIENLEIEIALIKKIIKPNGMLIAGLPNTNNLIFLLRQKYWEYLVPLEHVWHFSHRYLVNFLDKQGFQILKTDFSDDPRSDYPKIKQIYFFLLSLINKFLRTGELMTIYAQKI